MKVIATYYYRTCEEVDKAVKYFQPTLKPDEAILIVYPDYRICGGFEQMVVTSESEYHLATLDNLKED